MELCSFVEEIKVRPGESMERVLEQSGCKYIGDVDATTLVIVGGRLSETFRITAGVSGKVYELECPTRFDMMAWATQIKLHKAAEKRKVAEELGARASARDPLKIGGAPISALNMDLGGNAPSEVPDTEVPSPVRKSPSPGSRFGVGDVGPASLGQVKSVMHPCGITPSSQVLKPERAKLGRRGDEAYPSHAQPVDKLLEIQHQGDPLAMKSIPIMSSRRPVNSVSLQLSDIKSANALCPQNRIARKGGAARSPPGPGGMAPRDVATASANCSGGPWGGSSFPQPFRLVDSSAEKAQRPHERAKGRQFQDAALRHGASNASWSGGAGHLHLHPSFFRTKALVLGAGGLGPQ